MAYLLPSLEYEYDALSSSISADIMQLHHQKHHQAYVDKLNSALEGVQVAGSLSDLLSNLEGLPSDVRTAVQNHGGGHYNHSLFWESMSPRGGGEPTGELAAVISERYGSFQQFVEQFSNAAMGVFGSGWVWLQPDGGILTTPNQDNPLMSRQSAPVLGLDVWEHAYYLDYKNNRGDYVKAWWDVVDWQRVSSRL